MTDLLCQNCEQVVEMKTEAALFICECKCSSGGGFTMFGAARRWHDMSQKKSGRTCNHRKFISDWCDVEKSVNAFESSFERTGHEFGAFFDRVEHDKWT